MICLGKTNFFVMIAFSCATEFVVAGQNVGGGDELRIRVRQAQLFTSDIITEINKRRLPKFVPKKVREFLQDELKLKSLSDDIRLTEHDTSGERWDQTQGHRDAFTEYRPFATVTWNRGSLKTMSFQRIQAVIVHESMHHLGERSERFADQVAAVVSQMMPQHDPYFTVRDFSYSKKSIAASNKLIAVYNKSHCQNSGGYWGAYYHIDSQVWMPIKKPAVYFEHLCSLIKADMFFLDEYKVLIFGPRKDGGTHDRPDSRKNDMYLLDIRFNEWRQLNTLNLGMLNLRDPAYPIVFRYQAFLNKNILYVLFKSEEETASFDLNLNEWRRYDPAGLRPIEKERLVDASFVHLGFEGQADDCRWLLKCPTHMLLFEKSSGDTLRLELPPNSKIEYGGYDRPRVVHGKDGLIILDSQRRDAQPNNHDFHDQYLYYHFLEKKWYLVGESDFYSDERHFIAHAPMKFLSIVMSKHKQNEAIGHIYDVAEGTKTAIFGR